MKTRSVYKKESQSVRFSYAFGLKSLILCMCVFLGFQATTQAQEKNEYTKPSWYFGVSGGANGNFYRGSTQQLNDGFGSPSTFHDGFGVGLFLAPMIEFRPASSRWGIILQAGYDNRQGTFDQITTPCDCPADLFTGLSYLTIEPSIRFAPFKTNFYLYAGPRFAFNYSKSFKYQMGLNPSIPDQLASATVEGDLSNTRENLISMQIGAGYDIHLTPGSSKTQLVFSPFVSFQPYFGQDPRSIETLNITTLRVGASLKIGTGHKISRDAYVAPIAVVDNTVNFKVSSPENIVAERRVHEIFPLRNYVFFDLGSTEIPNRYVKLNNNQVKDFKEDDMSMSVPEDFAGRSERQMTVYYNILNILGERMSKNPGTTVNLVGSSEKGPDDGLLMANSVKSYLVNLFEINPSRITVEGRNKPKIPSVRRADSKEIVLLREGDRRVSIESSNPELLMEFQSGPDAPLKPVSMDVVQVAPYDSYVTFEAEGSRNAFQSWTMIITDESGAVKRFGPYTQEKVSIPGKEIMGTRKEGNYKVQMVGNSKEGQEILKDTTVHMTLWAAPENVSSTRFSILYEFDNKIANPEYAKYLTEVVIPQIPNGAKVIIHGHADVIGDDIYNQKLSLQRANDVKEILNNGLTKIGRNDVSFDVSGYGNDQSASPFANKYPEERFYNRTVIIDIVPK